MIILNIYLPTYLFITYIFQTLVEAELKYIAVVLWYNERPRHSHLTLEQLRIVISTVTV